MENELISLPPHFAFLRLSVILRVSSSCPNYSSWLSELCQSMRLIFRSTGNNFVSRAPELEASNGTVFEAV